MSCLELYPAYDVITAQGITSILRRPDTGETLSDFLGKYLRKRLEAGLASSGVRVSFMSLRLQAVLPGVSVPRYSSVRDGQVWGTTPLMLLQVFRSEGPSSSAKIF